MYLINPIPMKTTAGCCVVAFTLAAALSTPTQAAITLQPLGSYTTGVFDEGAQEIAAYDPDSQQVFVVNATSVTVDVLDISTPSTPTLVQTLDLSAMGGGLTSVSVKNGVLAVAVPGVVKTDPGSVAFYSIDTLELIHSVTVGALPDMLTFTPDGNYVLTANEGEPDDDYAIDPEGSVSIIDVSGGIENATVATADFTAFNGMALPGIRIFGPGASVAQDLEPEYIAVSADSKTAWATLQENNALAVIDVASATVTKLAPLGYKDHSAPGNGLDVSNEDGGINIANWPVWGMYQPDGIAAYAVGGFNFLVTANEGDSRDYDGFSEETRVADLKLDHRDIRPDVWKKLQKEENLGRLSTTVAPGFTEGGKRVDAIFAYGARSFSIWNADGNLVWDSGDQFELITAMTFPDQFNASNDNNSFDNRSDDKGPEPEGVALGEIDGATYAFIGLERIGGIMIYDVSNPTAPVFQDYVNNRDFTADPESPEAGDLGPEGLVFIPGGDSPNGEPLLVVANEISGSTTIYQVTEQE